MTSEALARWLEERQDAPKITSQISRVEVLRTCRRRDEGAVASARQVLAGLDLVPIAADVLEQAASANPSQLRSLDAVQLASALSVSEELSAFVAYDAKLAAAAADAGLVIAAPS